MLTLTPVRPNRAKSYQRVAELTHYGPVLIPRSISEMQNEPSHE